MTYKTKTLIISSEPPELCKMNLKTNQHNIGKEKKKSILQYRKGIWCKFDLKF